MCFVGLVRELVVERFTRSLENSISLVCHSPSRTCVPIVRPICCSHSCTHFLIIVLVLFSLSFVSFCFWNSCARFSNNCMFGWFLLRPLFNYCLSISFLKLFLWSFRAAVTTLILSKFRMYSNVSVSSVVSSYISFVVAMHISTRFMVHTWLLRPPSIIWFRGSQKRPAIMMGSSWLLIWPRLFLWFLWLSSPFGAH